METLANLTTSGTKSSSQLDSGIYARRDHDNDDTESGKMTTANFVLMFGILALVLLTLRAILMKTGSGKCRRKSREENTGEIEQGCVNSIAPSLNRVSSSDSCNQSNRRFGHISEHSRPIFMLSPPSYDNNHQYPAAAPPPYTPGDPAPIFADSSQQLSKTLAPHRSISPPPYDALPNVYKPPTISKSNQTENLQRQKSNDNEVTETTQL